MQWFNAILLLGNAPNWFLFWKEALNTSTNNKLMEMYLEGNKSVFQSEWLCLKQDKKLYWNLVSYVGTICSVCPSVHPSVPRPPVLILLLLFSYRSPCFAKATRSIIIAVTGRAHCQRQVAFFCPPSQRSCGRGILDYPPSVRPSVIPSVRSHWLLFTQT